MKLFTSIFLFALISVSAVFSQSAEIVEKTVLTEKLTYGTAAYFTAVAMGYISDDDSEEDAVDAWKKIGEQYSKPAIKAEISADDFINFENLAWLCYFTWNVPDSLMMKFFPSPRYAFKQLRNGGVISTSFDPKRIPTGREFLNVVTDCIDFYEVRN